MTVISGAARAVALIGGALSALFVIWAGIQWMTASGDPQKMAQARMSLIGTVVGVVIVGIGFLIPGVISEFIIEPAGGVAIESSPGINCDGILRDRLLVYRAASTHQGMNLLVKQVQSQRKECDPGIWNPVVKAATVADGDGCRDVGADPATVGGLVVPGSFWSGSGPELDGVSGRNSRNSVMVYWDDVDKPSDGSFCWLYNDTFDAWSEGG